MSSFGGMDQGVPGDRPYLGRTVAYQASDGVFTPAMVLEVREDGWTVSLRRHDTNELEEFVPSGAGREIGRIPVGTWVTLDEYEGWKIFASERREGGGS